MYDYEMGIFDVHGELNWCRGHGVNCNFCIGLGEDIRSRLDSYSGEAVFIPSFAELLYLQYQLYDEFFSSVTLN